MRPNTSDGLPMRMEPRIVPIGAMATVKPSQNSLSSNTFSKVSLVPEMTTVSKPSRNPPSPATIAARRTTPCRKRDEPWDGLAEGLYSWVASALAMVSLGALQTTRVAR